MINTEKELLSLLQALDAKLKEPLEVFMIGGANLLAIGGVRPTVDVDLVFPTALPAGARLAVMDIAEERGLDPFWFNCGPSMRSGQLPAGWREKAKTFFQRHCLTVRSVDRQLMIGLKILAGATRTRPDLDDLVWLKPSKKEIEIGREWAEHVCVDELVRKAIPEFIKELETQIRKTKRKPKDA